MDINSKNTELEKLLKSNQQSSSFACNNLNFNNFSANNLLQPFQNQLQNSFMNPLMNQITNNNSFTHANQNLTSNNPAQNIQNSSSPLAAMSTSPVSLLPAPTPSRGRKLEIFTKEQVDELNDFFNKNQYPSKAEKEYFAAKFNLEYSQIYGWFGAKRFKYKKQLGMDSHQFQQTMKFMQQHKKQIGGGNFMQNDQIGVDFSNQQISPKIDVSSPKISNSSPKFNELSPKLSVSPKNLSFPKSPTINLSVNNLPEPDISSPECPENTQNNTSEDVNVDVEKFSQKPTAAATLLNVQNILNLLKQQKTENIDVEMEKSPKTDSGQDEDKKDEKENTKEDNTEQAENLNEEIPSAEKCEFCDANKLKIGNLNKLVGQNVATDSIRMIFLIFNSNSNFYLTMLYYFLL